MLRIKLLKSKIGHNPRNRATIEALGLRKPNQVVEHEDTPTIRGMIHHVHPLLQVEEVEGTPAKRSIKGIRRKRTGGEKPAVTAAAPKLAKKAAPKAKAVKAVTEAARPQLKKAATKKDEKPNEKKRGGEQK